jgi:hypothetical protein
MLEFKMRELAHRIRWNPERQYSLLNSSHWLVQGRAIFFGPLSADQHKNIGILRGATSVKMRTGFITQNLNFKFS